MAQNAGEFFSSEKLHETDERLWVDIDRMSIIRQGLRIRRNELTSPFSCCVDSLV